MHKDKEHLVEIIMAQLLVEIKKYDEAVAKKYNSSELIQISERKKELLEDLKELYLELEEKQNRRERYFQKFIDVQGEGLFFSFTHIFTVADEKYHVTVTRDHEICSFSMKLDKFGNWKILDNVPDWILVVETELNNAITNNFQ